MNAIATQELVHQPYFVGGDVIARWLRHDGADRLMQLEAPVTFFDSSNRRWTARTGFVFDGATIPRALWTPFGDPFIGDYRRAAVIHDMLCTPNCVTCGRLTVDHGKRAEPRYVCRIHESSGVRYRVSSDEAASLFYEAMRADGVSEIRAAIMRRAVARWGPQFARG